MKNDLYEHKFYKRGFVNLKLLPDLNRELCVSAAMANRSKTSEILHRLKHHLDNFQVVTLPDNSFTYVNTSLFKNKSE